MDGIGMITWECYRMGVDGMGMLQNGHDIYRMGMIQNGSGWNGNDNLGMLQNGNGWNGNVTEWEWME